MQQLLDSVKSLSARERKALAVLLKRQGVNLYGVTPIAVRRRRHRPRSPTRSSGNGSSGNWSRTARPTTFRWRCACTVR